MLFRAKKKVIEPLHTLTFEQLVGKKPMLAPASFAAREGRQQMQVGLKAMYAAAPELWESRALLAVEGFSFSVKPKTPWDMHGVLCVWEEETGRMVGGQWAVVPRVAHAFRGLKLGTEICLAAYEAGMIPAGMPLFYTVEGLAARRSAHRVAVDRALAAGLDVPQRVINETYGLADKPAPVSAFKPSMDLSLSPAKRLRAVRKSVPAP